jgi:hypothetical protein
MPWLNAYPIRVKVAGPDDHGFGRILSFRDPDGNSVSVIEYGQDYW